MGNFFHGKKKPPITDRIHLTFKNGNSYKGEHKNKIPHGQGTLKTIDGDMYIGDFKNDLIEGHGKMFFKNGEFYIGNWSFNQEKR